MNRDENSIEERFQYFLLKHNEYWTQLLDSMGYSRNINYEAFRTSILTSKHFLIALSIKFPSVNLDWLIHGEGDMINTEPDAPRKRIPAPVLATTQGPTYKSLEEENLRLKAEIVRLRAETRSK